MRISLHNLNTAFGKIIAFLTQFASFEIEMKNCILSTDTTSSSLQTSADPRIKYPPSWRIPLLDINTLHNVRLVEELVQLTIMSDTEIITNSH